MFAKAIKGSSYNHLLQLTNRKLTGTAIPSGSVFRLGENGPEKVSTDDLFKNKKVVLFSYPGAFTGTCQNKQVPSFATKVKEFKAKGVDAVYAMSANDVFVNQAFQAETNSADLEYLQDFNAELSASMGKSIDLSALGLGVRTGRYSLLAENGKITQFFEESNPGELTVADGDTLLKTLQ